MATSTPTRFRTNALYPPGEFLKEELDERGMTQVALAKAMGRPLQSINAIIRGRKSITADTALQLERVLGIDAEIWLNLETRYQLTLARRLQVQTDTPAL